MSKKISKKSILIIALLLLINLIYKGIFLASNSLGGDEPFTVFHAQMPVISIIQLLSEGNNPPLFEILLHYWIQMFGISEFSVRFPSLIFSCVSLVFMYLICIKYLNLKIAITACILFIFSNYHIFFAHESRVYALLGMLSLISMYLYLSVLEANNADNSTLPRKPQTQTYVLLAIVNSLMMYAHYFGFFIVLVQSLFLLFNIQFVKKNWKSLALYVVLLVVFYLPNIFVFVNRFLESSKGTWLTPVSGLEGLYNMIWMFSNAPVVTVCILTLILACIIKWMLSKRKIRNNNNGVLLIIFWFTFIYLFMYLCSFWIPMWLDRYLMPAAIAFPIVISICANYIISIPKYSNVIPILCCLLFIFSSKPDFFNKRNVRDAVAQVTAINKDNTLVIVCPADFVISFGYYYNKDFFKDYHTKDIYLNIDNAMRSKNIFAINNIQEVDYSKFDRIIYLDASANFSAPDNNIQKELESSYKALKSYKVEEVYHITEYQKKQFTD